MKYLYLDESGDIGFDFKKANTTRFFVMSLVVADNEKIADRIVKKLIRNLPPKQIKQIRGTLHSYREKSHIKIKLLKSVVKHDLKLFSLIIDKTANSHLARTNKHKFYNAMTVDLLRVADFSEDDKFALVADRREANKNLRQGFIGEVGQNFPLAQIDVKRSSDCKGVQIADFLANVTWSKYEKSAELTAWEIIKDKTLDAFAGIHPVPLRQGIYLSYNYNNKAKGRSDRSPAAKFRNSPSSIRAPFRCISAE